MHLDTGIPPSFTQPFSESLPSPQLPIFRIEFRMGSLPALVEPEPLLGVFIDGIFQDVQKLLGEGRDVVAQGCRALKGHGGLHP